MTQIYLAANVFRILLRVKCFSFVGCKVTIILNVGLACKAVVLTSDIRKVFCGIYLAQEVGFLATDANYIVQIKQNDLLRSTNASKDYFITVNQNEKGKPYTCKASPQFGVYAPKN